MFRLYAECAVNGKNRGYVSFDNECFKLLLDESNNSIKAVLKAKKEFTFNKIILKDFMSFDNDDLFFANGYQAWTTSREFSKNDKLNGLIAPAKINPQLKHFQGFREIIVLKITVRQGVFIHTPTAISEKKTAGI